MNTRRHAVMGLLLKARSWVARLLLAVSLLPSASLPAQPRDSRTPATIGDRRFGVIESYAAPADAAALGAAWTRVTFEWNQIQPDGPNDWYEEPVAYSVLDAEIAAGRELVGLITATPGWAVDSQRGIGVPAGLYLPSDSPENTWAQFIRAIVSSHSARIKHWIIWNEPDIWDTQFQSWGGSVEDFAQLLKVSYVVAHQVDPDVVIHLPAITHWWDANYGRELFMRRLLRVLTAEPTAIAQNYYFDAITLHIYFNPDTVYDLCRLYIGLLAEFGISKPLWLVETNAAPSSDPSWPVANPQFRITQEDQAAFIIESLAIALAAGAQRVAVYKLSDTPTDTANPEPFGLVRLDGSRRPGFVAYQTGIRYLSGFESASLKRDEMASIVQVSRGTGWTTVLWARGPEPVEVVVTAHNGSSRATLVDWQGRQTQVVAADGQYRVTLPGSACTHPGSPCLIGGAPLLLVEGEVAARAPAPSIAAPLEPSVESAASAVPTTVPTTTPTPTRPPTHTPRPQATRTPWPTATVSSTRTPTATSSPAPVETSLATYPPLATSGATEVSETPSATDHAIASATPIQLIATAGLLTAGVIIGATLRMRRASRRQVPSE